MKKKTRFPEDIEYAVILTPKAQWYISRVYHSPEAVLLHLFFLLEPRLTKARYMVMSMFFFSCFCFFCFFPSLSPSPPLSLSLCVFPVKSRNFKELSLLKTLIHTSWDNLASIISLWFSTFILLSMYFPHLGKHILT